MPAPQFNKEATNSYWYSITYQSNNELNHALHVSAKQAIAKLLVDNFAQLHELHSYMHSSLKCSLNTNNPLANFDRMVQILNAPLAAHNPPLLFSIELVARSNNPNTNYMYIHGSDEMHANFLKSIEGFYPKKAKTSS
jgi:hypothetical protein